MMNDFDSLFAPYGGTGNGLSFGGSSGFGESYYVHMDRGPYGCGDDVGFFDGDGYCDGPKNLCGVQPEIVLIGRLI